MLRRGGRNGKGNVSSGLMKGGRGMTLASCPVPQWWFVAWCVYDTSLEREL